MKKMLSFIVCAALIISVLPLSVLYVSAATSGTTGHCIWTLDGTSLVISGNGAIDILAGLYPAKGKLTYNVELK